jgi:hypothetical protein
VLPVDQPVGQRAVRADERRGAMRGLADPDVGGVAVEPDLLGERGGVGRAAGGVGGQLLKGHERVGYLAGPAPLAGGGGLASFP